MSSFVMSPAALSEPHAARFSTLLYGGCHNVQDCAEPQLCYSPYTISSACCAETIAEGVLHVTSTRLADVGRVSAEQHAEDAPYQPVATGVFADGHPSNLSISARAFAAATSRAILAASAAATFLPKGVMAK
jgi:hypothetical protein